MPRKATKNSLASASRSSSKRPAPEPPARQSKRAKATTRKSYIEPGTDTDEAGDDSKRVAVSSTDEDEVAASDYEEHSNKDASSESEEEGIASNDDVEVTPRGRPAKSTSKHVDEKELWKPGAKLAPGTKLVIKKVDSGCIHTGSATYTDFVPPLCSRKLAMQATHHMQTILFIRIRCFS
jgi:hypothetical protein